MEAMKNWEQVEEAAEVEPETEEAEVEPEPETEAEAEAEDVEMDYGLKRKASRQHTTTTITVTSTYSTDSTSLSSDASEAPLHSLSREEGIKYSNNGSSSSVLRNGSSTGLYTSINGHSKDLDIQNGTVNDMNYLSDPSPSKNTFLEEQNVHDNPSLSDRINFEHERVELIRKELEKVEELTELELDLERVYEKPGQHNFYCPSCKACITKVIIIREKPREVQASTSVSDPLLVPAESFRCTSCFSFLIPLGNWFSKLVSPVGEVHTEQESSQESKLTLHNQPSQVASIEKASVPSNSVGVGNIVSTKSPEAEIDSTTRDPTSLAVIIGERSTLEGKVDAKKGNNIENVGVGMPKPSQESQEPLYKRDSQAELLNKAPFSEQPVGVSIILASNTRKPEIDNITNSKPALPSLEAVIVDGGNLLEDNMDGHKGNNLENFGDRLPDFSLESKGPIYDQGLQSASTNNDSFPDQLGGSSITLITKAPKHGVDSSIDSALKTPLLEAVIVDRGNIQDGTGNVNTGLSDTALPVSTSVVSGSTEIIETSEPSETKSWDILKSLVYGGLTESITSLGIVTSAASADAATPNILALALANLIGGLFIIGHNFTELKNQLFSRASSDQTDEIMDRYHELLGNRENFALHVFVAILSFLVFGLVPPVVYGFSFRVSDNKDLKLAAVAGASILCITLLAMAKAHVKKPTKWQTYITTILYYVAFAIGVSGLSYLAGDLIKKLIEKLGWFESVPAVSLSLPETSSIKPALGSY